MHIECPSCATENKIEFGDNVLCSECKETFSGHTYKKFKKPFLSATMALMIGGYGTYKADQIFFDEARYPVAVEYELIDSCVNSSKFRMNSSRLVEKKTICACALEKTMEKIGYKEANENETKFLSRFLISVTTCR